MQKPNDFDSININSTLIPAGGYVCKVMSVKEKLSKSGKNMIEVCFDIAEGELKDHYSQAYKSDTRGKDAKRWGCIYYILTTDKNGNTNKDLKRFCVFAEESNKNFKVEWGDKFENCFKNKLIGVVFRREQFYGNNGLAWSCKPYRLMSVEDIRNGKFEVPEDKLYATGSSTNTGGFTQIAPGSEDDDLPF